MARFGPAAVPSPGKKRKCGLCNGNGTVAIDPKDYRKGARRCVQCNGTGEF